MSADDVKKLRLSEQEKARLKKLFVELDIEVTQEIAAKKWKAYPPAASKWHLR